MLDVLQGNIYNLIVTDCFIDVIFEGPCIPIEAPTFEMVTIDHGFKGIELDRILLFHQIKTWVAVLKL